VVALSDLPIDEIVLQRLHDMAPSVRRALLLASVMGTRFVVDLVDRLAQARFESNVRDDLEDGESRYRFVRDVLDRSRNDVASFSERLFSDAAESYRSFGMAKTSIENWPDETDLYTVLDDLLDMVVADPNVFENLSQDDRAHAISLAADRMLFAASPRAGLALAQLVHVENARGNPEGAYEAAQRFIAGFSEDG